MGELEAQLIKRAIRRHKKIFPCSRRGGIDECFTREKGRLLFWFNTQDRSTHVISAKIISAKGLSRRKTVIGANAK